MSITEIIVVLFGLFVGYWIVARLFLDSERKGEEPSSRSTSGHKNDSRDKAEQPWHEVLNVPPHATIEEIRVSYKSLMQQYHPDKVASLGVELKVVAERKSKEISVAYQEAMRFRGETT